MHACYGLNICVPQSSCVEAPICKVMLFGGGSLGCNWCEWGHGDGAPVVELAAL